jgi:hypothetical protein
VVERRRLLVVEGAARHVELFGDVVRFAPGEILLAHDDERTPAHVGRVRLAWAGAERVQGQAQDVAQGKSSTDGRRPIAGRFAARLHQG